MTIEEIAKIILDKIAFGILNKKVNLEFESLKEKKQSLVKIKIQNTEFELNNRNIIIGKKSDGMTNIFSNLKLEFLSKISQFKENEYSNIELENIYDELTENLEIRKMLYSGAYVENIVKNNPIFLEMDYSFVIMNNVKAIEYYLVCYLKKVKQKYGLHADRKLNVYATDYKFKKWYQAVSLDNLIKYIDNNKDKLLKTQSNKLLIENLDYFRKNMRNGYFHKHIIEDRKQAYEINFKCYVLLVQLILNLNK